MVRSDPALFGSDTPRLTLEEIRLVAQEFLPQSESGVWRLLDRLGIAFKRGRLHVHSPDPEYFEKLHTIRDLFEAVREEPDRYGLVFVDEMGYGRSPTLSQAWEAKGPVQPLARQGHASDTLTRIMAALDPLDGRVVFRQRRRFGIAAQIGFYKELRQAYPSCERVYVALDNWPLHFHPNLLCALEPQLSRFPRHLPPSWPEVPSAEALRKWGGLRLPIQLVPLPTYAPWTNPIEKLWRGLRQRVLHLHRLADDLEALRARVRAYLEAFREGSKEVLRYVGLGDLEKLYHFL